MLTTTETPVLKFELPSTPGREAVRELARKMIAEQQAAAQQTVRVYQAEEIHHEKRPIDAVLRESLHPSFGRPNTLVALAALVETAEVDLCTASHTVEDIYHQYQDEYYGPLAA